MADFTPGPWEYLREITFMNDYPLTVAHRVKIGNETLTFDCHDAVLKDDFTESEANARLIAASPEMYEELKATCEVCDSEYKFSDDCIADCTVKKVLAKAEGKEVD